MHKRSFFGVILAQLLLRTGALLAAEQMSADLIEPVLPGGDTGRQAITIQPPAEPTVGGEFSAHRFVDFRRDSSAAELREAYDGKYLAAPMSPRRWQLVLGLTTGAYYDDNIRIGNDNEEEDFVFTISPTIGIIYGDPRRNSFTLLYTPTALFFVDNDEENTLEQALDLSFTRRTDRWRMTLNAGLRDLSGADQQTGERTDRLLLTAGARANYIVSDKTSLELTLGTNFVDYDRFFDTVDFIGLIYADYLITPKTSLGLGIGTGYAQTEDGPGQVYEQFNIRAKYAATSKLAVNATAGVEFRQIEGGDNQTNPVMGVGATFTPFHATTLNLDAYRRIRPSSVFPDANYTVTGAVLSLRQRLLQKYYFGVAGGYEASDYNSIDRDGSSLSRDDDYFFVRPSLEFRLGERYSVELYYEHRNNHSNIADFEFENNRTGFKFSAAF